MVKNKSIIIKIIILSTLLFAVYCMQRYYSYYVVSWRMSNVNYLISAINKYREETGRMPGEIDQCNDARALGVLVPRFVPDANILIIPNDKAARKCVVKLKLFFKHTKGKTILPDDIVISYLYFPNAFKNNRPVIIENPRSFKESQSILVGYLDRRVESVSCNDIQMYIENNNK